MLFGWLTVAGNFILASRARDEFRRSFRVVGCSNALRHTVAVIVPKPAGTRSNVPPVEEGLDPSIDEPFLPVPTEETP